MASCTSCRKSWIWVLVILFCGAIFIASVYNHLVSLDQQTQAQWAQVQTVYQRRADLIPNLVSTVKGAASFEKSTLEAVTQARAQAMQASKSVALPGAVDDPKLLAQYQAAQDQLSQSLTRFFAVAEAYPQLTATQNYRDLQVQLEGTENRIAVERQRYNQAARAFNTKRQSFPTNVFASFFGSKFAEKPYFASIEGSDKVPEVQF